jgi:hypothetical protein
MGTERLDFTIGNKCEESTHNLRTTLFVELENDDKESLNRILHVSFFVEDAFVEIKNLPPFVSRLLTDIYSIV